MEAVLDLANRAVTLVPRNTKTTELQYAYNHIKEQQELRSYFEGDSDSTRMQEEHDKEVTELIKAYCKLANEALDSISELQCGRY